jgi:2-polyprenyl-3-methyl-5-hydroxy-6-metoxy-1,4-benzoquinol methylase
MASKFVLLIVLAIAAFSAVADRPALPPEAADFLKWYESYQGSFYPQDVLKAYQERLASQGVAQPEVDRRLGVVRDAMRAMPVEFTAIHFNKIYTAPNPPFRPEPSQFMVRIAEGLKPGAALDVAMGQGRNALYLAGKGWSVTGYDISGEGLQIAQARARKEGLALQAVKATHDQFDYGKERWDLIVETFAFTPLNDEAYRKRLVDSLRPGGVLLIEGFGGAGPESKPPKNVMLEGFRDLRVIYYEDRVDVADWSMQKARITRIAVQKD